MAAIEDLIRSWHPSDEYHSFSRGAGAEEIKVFEEEAGWRLPAEWRELYAHTNGVSLFNGNVSIVPLFGGDSSLLELSQCLRRYNWPVPDELCIAGNNGQGDHFGLWLPAATGEVCPIVDLGQIFKPGCLAIAASSLSAFLLLRTVYFLFLYGDDYYGYPTPPEAALDILNVPPELRSLDPHDDLTWPMIARWADRNRPAGLDDPYLRRLTASEVRRKLREGAP